MFEEIPETTYGMRKRIQFIYEEINQRIKNISKRDQIKILDIGCGSGEFVTLPLSILQTNILGIDIHVASIEHAKRENRFSNVKFECKSVNELFGQKFDFIICSEVLEHLPEPINMLKKIKNLLKHNGICIITIPNGYGPKENEVRLYNFLFKIKVVNVLKLLKKLVFIKNKGKKIIKKTILTDTYNKNSPHIQFFRYKKFKNLVEKSELKIIKRENRRFLSGPFSDRILSKSELLITWNTKIANKIPYLFVSSWMFVVEHQK